MATVQVLEIWEDLEDPILHLLCGAELEVWIAFEAELLNQLWAGNFEQFFFRSQAVEIKVK